MTRLTIWSPQRRNSRDVDVYLPSSYERGRLRYPVVYMQDGQNLSDPSIAFAGTWGLNDVMRDLAADGLEAIVVGIHNTRARIAEYSPFPHATHGGGAGESYLSFLADTLKPRIDRRFRTKRTAAHTVIAGSSMGGLFSLYAWLRRPAIFGHAAVLSPALWFGRDRLFEFVEDARMPRGRLYVDVGTAEGAGTLRDARQLKRLLEARGIGDRLMYLEDRGGRHDEASWGRRIGRAIEVLLAPR